MKNRTRSISVGVLILLAYGIVAAGNPETKLRSMFLEITSGFAVLGIATLMYPLLNPYGKYLSFSYLFLKGFEGGIMILAGVLFFLHSSSLLALREALYSVHAYIFAISAVIFYYLLYHSKLVPRWISVWGIIAALLVIIVNILGLVISNPVLNFLYLPIVLNEVLLALWLIVKGTL